MTFHAGPKLATVLPYPSTGVSSLHTEYGDLQCTVELVNNLQEAIDIINTYGSGHTDAVVTEDGWLLMVINAFCLCLETLLVVHSLAVILKEYKYLISLFNSHACLWY